MARKLLCLVALIGLVLLTQAPPGFANPIYPIYYTSPESIYWSEVHGGPDPGFVPGYAGGTFFANDYSQGLWFPGTSNSADVSSTPVASGQNWVTYKIVYDTLPDGSLAFTASFGGGIDIYATTPVTITTTATYVKGDGGLPAYAPDSSGVYHYTLTDADPQTGLGTMTMTASGQTDDGMYFTMAGTLVERERDGQHTGYFSDLALTYYGATAPITSDPGPSAVPLPGAVWLLGSGLFGLASLRPRRKS